jgi:hypothetical protein
MNPKFTSSSWISPTSLLVKLLRANSRIWGHQPGSRANQDLKQKHRHYAESVAVVRRYVGRCAAKVASGLAMVSMVQIKNKQATGITLFVSTINDRPQFFGTSKNAAKAWDNGGLS